MSLIHKCIYDTTRRNGILYFSRLISHSSRRCEQMNSRTRRVPALGPQAARLHDFNSVSSTPLKQFEHANVPISKICSKKTEQNKTKQQTNRKLFLVAHSVFLSIPGRLDYFSACSAPRLPPESIHYLTIILPVFFGFRLVSSYSAHPESRHLTAAAQIVPRRARRRKKRGVCRLEPATSRRGSTRQKTEGGTGESGGAISAKRLTRTEGEV